MKVALKNKILTDIHNQQLPQAYQSFQRQQESNSRSLSPITPINHEDGPGIQTFVFSLLPPEEKKRFMDFLIDNSVEFKQDSDGTYNATIKIVNQQVEQPPQVINGIDQMKMLRNNQGFSGISSIVQKPVIEASTMLQNQIQDLDRYHNKLKQLDKHEVESHVKNTPPPKQQPKQGLNMVEETFKKVKSVQVIQTSPAQLQVYMKPEYVEFTRLLAAKNPQTIRPKRMNIQQTLRLIEDIYAFRFQQKAQAKSQMTLVEGTVELLYQRFNRLKAKVDQVGFDLLASIEQHKETSLDVRLFYNFLTFQESYQLKELVFFLYIRSLAEQLLSVMFHKLPSSQDIRSVHLSLQKCQKIAKVYYQNAIIAQSHLEQEPEENLDHQADQMASNLVEVCAQEAQSQDQLFDGKIQVTLFLEKLLQEFQHQESIQLMPQSNSKKQDFLREDIEEEEDHTNNQPNNRTVELLTTVIQYVVNVKLETIIKVMLEHHSSPISTKVVQQINTEAKEQMSRMIAGLLQAAFTTDEQTWFDLLKISDTATDEHLEQFISVTELINTIFDSAQYDLNRTNPVQVNEDILDELAKTLF